LIAGSAATPALSRTGDTDTGLYFPTANEVAVSVGGVTVASFNQSGMGITNRIINGAMQIWQRGTSFSTPSSGAYTADRMYVGWAGAAPATIARVAGSNGFKYALRVTGAASNTTLTVGQKIESVNIADLASKTVTLSVVLLASTNQTFTWAAFYANAADDFSGVTQISTGTWSVTTSAATYSANISLPSQAANGVQIQIYPNAAGAFTSGTFDMTGFQVEQGSVATPFERRLYGQELTLCQRYYEMSIAQGTTGYNTMAGGTNAIGGSTNDLAVTTVYKATKRASPTVVPYSSSTGTANAVRDQIAGADVTSVSTEGNDTGFRVYKTSAFTVGRFYSYSWNASAEL